MAPAGRRPRSHKHGRGNSASHLAQWRGISGFLSFQNRQSLSTCLVEASFWQRGQTAVPLRVPRKTAPCQTARMPVRRSGRDLCLWTSRLGTVQSTAGGLLGQRAIAGFPDLASEGRFSPEGLPGQIRIDVNTNRGFSPDGPMIPLRRCCSL